MPVLAFDMDPSLPRITRIDPKTGKTSIDPDQYRRLSPFNPEVRQRIIDIYRDMAYSAPIDGIIYHDDAVMSDFEDASPDAIRAYEKAGFPGSITTIRQDPEMMQRWTRYKSKYLIDFTNELTREVRDIRGPQVKSARNIFAMPILEPESEAWFAQNLDDFLANYDWVAPMAMPLMEKVPLSESNEWLAELVNKVAQRPGALEKTVFELQSKDWT
ncbi:poly-beta-1,6-N-acetyl-D-glucosamine N-deacetylase PgaB, partial [Yersinia pestis]